MARRRKSAKFWLWVLLPLLLAAGGRAVAVDEARYLRVGTGPPGETHFQIGNLLASAISAPPGLPPCARGGSCGVPGLIALASATNGSVANIEAIADGRLDAALTQADVPFWAATGVPPFAGRPITSLRAVANLGTDQMHLVVWRDGPIHALRDLRGKRVSLGENGSGTRLHARQLLAALGIKESEVKEDNQRSAVAADALLAGKIDAFFVMDAPPVPSVEELAKRKPIRLIGVTGPAAEKMRRADPLLFPGRVQSGTYAGVDGDTPTLAVGVTLVVAASLPDDLVFALTQSLWQPATVALLNDAHHGGTPITVASALAGLGLPLHPGAQRFYADKNNLR
jgi:TRAP transporter TAXI family solute receptor